MGWLTAALLALPLALAAIAFFLIILFGANIDRK